MRREALLGEVTVPVQRRGQDLWLPLLTPDGDEAGGRIQASARPFRTNWTRLVPLSRTNWTRPGERPSPHAPRGTRAARGVLALGRASRLRREEVGGRCRGGALPR